MKITQPTKSDFIGFLILVAYLLLFLGLGQRNHQEIHDSLEQYVPNLRSALSCNSLWDLNPNSTIESIMNGVPRHCFHNSLDMLMVLFTCFEPFTAYAINFILVHLIAFVGFYMLFKNHLLAINKEWETEYRYLPPLCAAAFSVLPLYPLLGITFAGVPILLWSFLNVITKKKIKLQDIFIIALFAFYSSFVYMGVFCILSASLIVLYKAFSQRKLEVYPIIWILSLTLFSILFNYLLLYQVFFDHDFVSHRESWIPDAYNIKVIIWAFYNMLVHGQYHAASFHELTFALILVIAALRLLKIINPSKLFNIGLILFFCVFSISGFYGLWQWIPVVEFKEKIRLLKIFRWDRFYFFNPILWSTLFSISILLVATAIKNRSTRNFIVISIFSFQIAYIITRDYVARQNMTIYTETFVSISEDTKKNWLGNYYYAYQNGISSYENYFQVDVYREIAKTINKPFSSYRVGSVGVNPALALYNGFFTIDAYMTSYPNAHKQKLYAVIERELNENDKTRHSFVDWGSRGFLFANLNNCPEDQGCELKFNFQALKDLNCSYLISLKKLNTTNEERLRLIDEFPSKLNSQVFFLYEVI
jgi:hypothetical protein